MLTENVIQIAKVANYLERFSRYVLTNGSNKIFSLIDYKRKKQLIGGNLIHLPIMSLLFTNCMSVAFLHRLMERAQIRFSLLKSMIDMHRGFPGSCSGINSLLGSHDQCGDRHQGHQNGGCHRYYISRVGGRNNWHCRAKVRMWYALQVMSRGLPMIFMGTEILQEGWRHVDDYHPFNWRLIEE